MIVCLSGFGRAGVAQLGQLIAPVQPVTQSWRNLHMFFPQAKFDSLQAVCHQNFTVHLIANRSSGEVLVWSSCLFVLN